MTKREITGINVGYMNAYSLDFRKAVLAYVDEGHSQRETTALFKITPRCVSRWLKLREQGKLQALPVPRSPHKLFLEPLKEYIDKHPDSTLAEIAKHFNCGINAVFKALRKLGYTYKKNKKSIKKETNQRGRYLLKE